VPNPNALLVKGVVCGVRVKEVPDPPMKKIRVLDKRVDELATANCRCGPDGCPTKAKAFGHAAPSAASKGRRHGR
jgi:hypothetical protein